MRQTNSCINHKSLLIIILLAIFAVQAFAQKNTDGTYTLRKPDGTMLTYYPTRPAKADKEIDSLAVEAVDGSVEMFYRIGENNTNAGKLQSINNSNDNNDLPKITNEDGTVAAFYTQYPNCDCEIDTLLVEQPDGSFKQYYTIKSGNKNILKKDMIINAAKKIISIDVYENAEVMPRYKSGKNELVNYIKKNIRFNNNGKRYLGALNINFIVMKNGKIENVKMDKEYAVPPAALEKDIMRILKNMPAWKPGKVSGKPVNVYYSLQMNLVI